MFLGNMERFRKGPLINTSRMAQEAKSELDRWGFGAVPVNVPSGTLSIEKRKMAEITKALSTDPKVVIFDETTQSLSYDTRRQLYKIIDGLKEKGVAIVMITHDLEEIVDLADSISVLRDGHLVGTVEKKDRSLMNVPFITGNEELDKKFVAEAKAAGFENLKGHRTVGGMRASIYNAMPIEGVEKLVAFMKKFEEENA